MEDQKAQRTKTYTNDLRKFIDSQNYQKVVKTSNKILSEKNSPPLMVQAWQCKMTALILQGNFQEALNSIKACKDHSPILFEKAYCEYRLNDCSTALQTLTEIKSENSGKVKELKAQILYRLERYDECFAIYRDLIKNVSDSYDQERLSNLLAVAVNRAFDGSKEKIPDVGTGETYEQLYNKACGLLTSKDYEKALEIFKDAKRLCVKLLEKEEATEDEINEETAIIRVQEGYCLQYLGREKEALGIYNAVLKLKPDDPSLIAILSTNIVAINREANVFDSKKRVKATQVPGLEHKLTGRQKGGISLNNCLLAYHTNQDKLCEKEISNLKKNSSAELSLSVALIEASKLARAGNLKDSSLVLANHGKLRPEDASVATLSAVQILLGQSGGINESINMLMSLRDPEKFRLGILSALLVLCSKAGRCQDINTILDAAIQWHKENKTPAEKLGTLCREVANYHLKNGNPKSAAVSLEDLRKLYPKDTGVLAQLISAYSQFDTETAKKLSKELPSAADIISKFDVESLVASVGMRYVRKAGAKGADNDDAEETEAQSVKAEIKKAKKKKKRIILPKKMVEGVKPDPERWLPRWQRANIKKKKDRRQKVTDRNAVGKGTQGGSSEAADKFDITKNASEKGTGTSRPPTEWSKKNPNKNKKGKWKK